MINIGNDDLPSLYAAVDGASNRAQSKYLCAIRAHSFLLISGAGLGVVGIKSAAAALLAAALFLSAMFLSIFIAAKKYEVIWYRARAVAESVKTSSWRYMMKADPYLDASSVIDVRTQFRTMLLKILSEHKSLSAEFAENTSSGDAVTEGMSAVRAMDFEDRLIIYMEDRVEDQRGWYEKKARYSRQNGSFWFIVFTLLQAAAVCFALARVAAPSFQNWPVELFAVAAASTFTWIHLKRFRELSAAYALTAHEITVLKGGAELVKDDTSLADFVSDSENAFSREHTQWVARKE